MINIKACGPRINLPSPTHQGTFMVSLGDIEILSQSGIPEDYYEIFELKISSIELRYITNEKYSFPIIPTFGINNIVNFLKSRFRIRKWELKEKKFHDKADIIVSGELPRLSVELTPSTYDQLSKINEIFVLDDNINSKLTLDKKIIMRKASLISKLKKQGSGIQSWCNYFAVLSGGYIYFFNSEKESTAYSYYYIKDCSLIDISEKIGVQNTLKLFNRYGECVLSFDKNNEFIKWINGLNESIMEFQSALSAAPPTPKFKKANKIWLEIGFGIPEISLKLCNEERTELSEFYLSSIFFQSFIKVYDISAHVSLKSLYIKDSLRKSYSDHFNYLARSMSNDHQSLIDIDLNYISIESNEYNDQDIDAKIKFG